MTRDATTPGAGRPSAQAPDATPPDVSIIVVSYNTRELTLACLDSVYAQTRRCRFELLVVDNQSTDGSADAIAQRFPDATLLKPAENLGFARANNLAAERAAGEFLLLLNPDTVVLDGAIDRLVAFARAHPDNGIYGGRTLFGDGSLNPTSCWGRSTPWSEFCHAVGLSAAFRGSRLLNPEGLGSWRRDSVREVDIVTGCFLLLPRALWERLGGFHPDFFMYGEEADLCLRARRLGVRPIITPEATIMHYGGRSENKRIQKMIRMLRARGMLIQRHWSGRWIRFGQAMQALAVLNRYTAWTLLRLTGRPGAGENQRAFAEVWARRKDWMGASPPPAAARQAGDTSTRATPSG